MKSFRTALESGRPQLGCAVGYTSPAVIEQVGADWDWMWLDGQHGQMGYGDMVSLIRACDVVGTTPIVRIDSHERGLIARTLDAGAMGLIVPQVHTAAAAKAVVDAAKFPPTGDRSWGGGRVANLRPDYLQSANRETIVIAQIESPEALDNADAIAAVEGVDALHYGSADVGLRRNPPTPENELAEVERKEAEAILQACRAHGKFMAIIAIDPDKLRWCASLRMEMIMVAAENLFIAQGSQSALESAQGVLAAL